MKSIEQYFLGKLVEESNEVGQITNKTSDFGMDEAYQDGPTNRKRLHMELDDFMAVIEELNANHKLDYTPNQEAIKAKRAKMQKYLRYAQSLGRVEAPESTKPRRGKIDIMWTQRHSHLTEEVRSIDEKIKELALKLEIDLIMRGNIPASDEPGSFRTAYDPAPILSEEYNTCDLHLNIYVGQSLAAFTPKVEGNVVSIAFDPQHVGDLLQQIGDSMRAVAALNEGSPSVLQTFLARRFAECDDLRIKRLAEAERKGHKASIALKDALETLPDSSTSEA